MHRKLKSAEHRCITSTACLLFVRACNALVALVERQPVEQQQQQQGILVSRYDCLYMKDDAVHRVSQADPDRLLLTRRVDCRRQRCSSRCCTLLCTFNFWLIKKQDSKLQLFFLFSAKGGIIGVRVIPSRIQVWRCAVLWGLRRRVLPLPTTDGRLEEHTNILLI